MRTCYIHIGGKKTGSTSIQFALKRNKDILNKFNFFIDDTLGAVEDKALAKWVMKPDEFNAKNRVEQYMENVRRAFLLGSQSAIISAESLTDLYIEEIESLYHLLRPLFDRFVVIMYVRRQDIVASSHYSTALKGGSTSKKLMSFGMGKRGGRPFSYGSIMHDWAKVFGQESLRIRRYVEKAEGQWDAVNDFLHLLPVPISTSKMECGAQNVALNAQSAAYLRAFNCLDKRRKSPTSINRKMVLGILNSWQCHIPVPKPQRKVAVQFYEEWRKENEMLEAIAEESVIASWNNGWDQYPTEPADINSFLTDDIIKYMLDQTGGKLTPYLIRLHI